MSPSPTNQWPEDSAFSSSKIPKKEKKEVSHEDKPKSTSIDINLFGKNKS